MQDKYKRATSSRYRATHGGIQSNRQKAKLAATPAPILDPSSSSSSSSDVKQHEDFPELVRPPITSSETQLGLPKTANDGLVDHTLAPQIPAASFARRQLASNAHRYLEPEPDPNLEAEPEIDLTKFVEKQQTRIAAEEARKQARGGKREEEEEDVDASFEHLFQHSSAAKGVGHSSSSRSASSINRLTGKPTKVFIEDRSTLGLDELDNERKKADASRDLIARFSAAQLDSSNKPAGTARNKRPLIRSKLTHSTAKTSASLSNPKELVLPLDDEDFLDEVLNDSSGTYGKFKRT